MQVSTKIPVLKSLLGKCDKILIGGGMIFTFYKAQVRSGTECFSTVLRFVTAMVMRA